MHGAPHVVPDMDGQRAARPIDAEIAGLATRQHGVVGRSQLVALGLSLDAIDHRVEQRRLLRLHRGVYAVGHRRLARAGAWMAAVLAAGQGAVISHRSAGALWGIREWRGQDVEVTVPRRRRTRAGLVVHEAQLPTDETTTHDGIPVTTPARTLLDLAALLDEHQLARAAERAEALRLASPTSLADLVRRYPRRAGTPNLRRLVEEQRIVPTDTRSALERRFLTFLDANDLPRPLVNERHDAITPDFRWTTERLVVEVDGFETHGTRQAFERDRARDRRLLAEGWRVARVTQRQLDDDPSRLAGELRALLRSATTAAPGPRPGPRTPAPRSRPAGR
jgi:predicted transcriptional regulator of viral defense system